MFCASSTRIDPVHVELAAAVGRSVGERGWGLVSGGGSISMMGAVAASCRAAGGRTTGVIPRALLDAEVADQDSDELVVVDTMRERKAEMDRRADAFLALPGGIGTLEELFEIWTARTLGMHDKPVVVLDPLGVLAPLHTQLRALLDSGFVRAQAFEVLTWTDDLDTALDACVPPTPSGQAADRPA